MKEANSFQAVIASALAAMKDTGGVTARALPARFGGDGRLSPYRGSNVLLLALAGKDMASSVWGTANALRDATGRLIAKGQSSLARVVFAGLKDAPQKKEDALVDPRDPQAIQEAKVQAESGEDAPPKGKVRVYRTIPCFSASQLAGDDAGTTLQSAIHPSRESIDWGIKEALKERAQHLPPGERALDDRLTAAVMAFTSVMVDWRQGKKATISAHFFESAADLLTICGVSQWVMDQLTLPPGFYAYGVPTVVDPAEMAGLAKPVEPAAAPTVVASPIAEKDESEKAPVIRLDW